MAIVEYLCRRKNWTASVIDKTNRTRNVCLVFPCPAERCARPAHEPVEGMIAHDTPQADIFSHIDV